MSTPRPERGRWLRVLILIVAIVLLAPLLMMVVMMPMMGMMWGWAGDASRTGMGMSPMWGMGMMLLFLVVLLGMGYLIYWAFTRGPLAGADPALEELRLAYARGDLSEEEFKQRQDDLRKSK